MLLGGSLFASAQKNTWTIGFYTGIQGQMNTAVEWETALNEQIGEYITWGGYSNTRTIHSISSAPPAELIVQYKITDCFSVASGIGYGLHKTLWSFNKFNNPMEDFAAYKYGGSWSCRTGLQLPLIFQYDVPFINTGFSCFFKLGLYIDFDIFNYGAENYRHSADSVYYNFGDKKTYYPEFYDRSYFELHRVNFLVHTGFGFSYRFHSGLGLSLSGTYNAGTLLTDIFHYNLKLKNPDTKITEREYDYYVYNRNQNWNVLLGVTYTFKKKEK